MLKLRVAGVAGDASISYVKSGFAHLGPFEDALKIFDDFKNKHVKVCIFWKYIQCTIHWDKTQMLKKNFLWTK